MSWLSRSIQITAALAAALAAGATVAVTALAQARLPSTLTTATSRAIGEVRDSALRPIPTAGPPTIVRPEATWVPDRFITVPGTSGEVHIPAHWERRLPDGSSYVPPLTGVAPDGQTVLVPAGRYPPAEQRQAP